MLGEATLIPVGGAASKSKSCERFYPIVLTSAHLRVAVNLHSHRHNIRHRTTMSMPSTVPIHTTDFSSNHFDPPSRQVARSPPHQSRPTSFTSSRPLPVPSRPVLRPPPPSARGSDDLGTEGMSRCAVRLANRKPQLFLSPPSRWVSLAVVSRYTI